MQKSGRNRRGRQGRQRGASKGEQPLTNESTMGILNKKRRKKTDYSVPPSAIDPNYVPGKNPQYVEPEEVQDEELLDDGDDHQQPMDSGYVDPNAKAPSHQRNKKNNQRGRSDNRSRGKQKPNRGKNRSANENDGDGESRKGKGRNKGRNDWRDKTRSKDQSTEPKQHQDAEGKKTETRDGDSKGNKSQNRSSKNNRGKSRRSSDSDGRRSERGKNQRGTKAGKRGQRRGRGLGLAKKKNEQDVGRSKVYTSDMFLYSENLDPNVPTERKMRSRRNKPADDNNSEE